MIIATNKALYACLSYNMVIFENISYKYLAIGLALSAYLQKSVQCLA